MQDSVGPRSIAAAVSLPVLALTACASPSLATDFTPPLLTAGPVSVVIDGRAGGDEWAAATTVGVFLDGDGRPAGAARELVRRVRSAIDERAPGGMLTMGDEAGAIAPVVSMADAL